nr:hypothetical protein Iba_chr12dCG15350 [Ipomoea batatas]GMD73086.1 hypothetical protein Iba_chr12fCG14930 [Ipomoea batatas]
MTTLANAESREKMSVLENKDTLFRSLRRRRKGPSLQKRHLPTWFHRTVLRRN